MTSTSVQTNIQNIVFSVGNSIDQVSSPIKTKALKIVESYLGPKLGSSDRTTKRRGVGTYEKTCREVEHGSPENKPLEKEIPNLETQILRFHVKFLGVYVHLVQILTQKSSPASVMSRNSLSNTPNNTYTRAWAFTNCQSPTPETDI